MSFIKKLGEFAQSFGEDVLGACKEHDGEIVTLASQLASLSAQSIADKHTIQAQQKVGGELSRAVDSLMEASKAKDAEIETMGSQLQILHREKESNDFILGAFAEQVDRLKEEKETLHQLGVEKSTKMTLLSKEMQELSDAYDEVLCDYCAELGEDAAFYEDYCTGWGKNQDGMYFQYCDQYA